MTNIKQMALVGVAGFALMTAPAFAGVLGGSASGGAGVGAGNVGIHSGADVGMSKDGVSASGSSDTDINGSNPDVSGTAKATGSAASDAADKAESKAKATGDAAGNMAKDAGASASGKLGADADVNAEGDASTY